MGREIDLDVAVERIKLTVRWFISCNPYLLKFYDETDLVQQVFTHFLEKKMIPKYDPTVTSFDYFIAAAAKRYLIDLTRKRIHIMKSLSSLLSDASEERELMDLVYDTYANDAELSVIFKELLENIPDDQISPNYDLTWKELLHMVIEGQKPKDISKQVMVERSGARRNLSAGRVSALISKLRDKCIDLMRGEIYRVTL